MRKKNSFLIYSVLLAIIVISFLHISNVEAAEPNQEQNTSTAGEETQQCITEEQRIQDPSFNAFQLHQLQEAALNIKQTTKPIDPLRPNLCSLSNGACPQISKAYTFTPNQGESTDAWGETQAVGIKTNGSNIYVPVSGQSVGSNMQVLVSNINVASGTISLQYTLDAGFSNANGGSVNRYDLSITGININPAIVEAFNSRGEGSLPALPAGYNLGTKKGDEVIVSMADTGAFMDLTEINDFWKEAVSFTEESNLILLKYNACPYIPEELLNSCKQPAVYGDSMSCLGECLGVTQTIDANVAKAKNFISSIPIIGSPIATFLFAKLYEIPIALDDGAFKTQIPKFNNPAHNELYGENTTPVAFVGGDFSNIDNPSDFYYEGGQNPDKGKFPPRPNSSIQNLLTPEGISPNKVVQQIKRQEELPTQVKIYIEDAGTDAAAGIPQGNYWPSDKLKKLGMSVDIPKDCSNGCWIPQIKVCNPENSDCGGGSHAIYVTYDPNGPTNQKAIMDSGSNTFTFESKPGAPDQLPVWSKGNNVSMGTPGGGTTSSNSAVIYNMGHDCLNDDGSVTVNGHCPTAVNWQWCTEGVENCTNGYSEIKKGNLQQNKQGGPIITAQKGMYTSREIYCAYFQSFFAPPQIVYCDGTMPGIAKEDKFSKNVLTLRDSYKKLLASNQTDLDLSEDEKTAKIFKLAEMGQSKLNARLEQKYGDKDIADQPTNITSNNKAIDEVAKKDGRVVGDNLGEYTKTEQTAFFSPPNSCPYSVENQKESPCDNESALRPKTTIYIDPEFPNVECPGGDCTKVGPPGEEIHTHRMLVATAASSGININSPTYTDPILGSDMIKQSISEYYRASINKDNTVAAIRPMSKVEKIVSLDVGLIQLAQGMMVKMTNTPDDTRVHDESIAIKRPINLIPSSDPLYFKNTFSKFELSSQDWEKPMEGSIPCLASFNMYKLNPEQNYEIQQLINHTKRCFENSGASLLYSNMQSEELLFGAGAYYKWDPSNEDYGSQTDLTKGISGTAMFYSNGWGEHMETPLINQGFMNEGETWEQFNKRVCEGECIGAGAMLRAGDKGRVVCISYTKNEQPITYKVFVGDVASKKDIPNLLNRGWAIDLDFATARVMGKVVNNQLVGGVPVTVTNCN